jgi:hypothetical protein
MYRLKGWRIMVSSSVGSVRPPFLICITLLIEDDCLEFPPKGEAPMHYTDTTDYIVLTHGTCELVLHDGSKSRVVPGNVVIVHHWWSKSETTVLVSLIPISPISYMGWKEN